MLLSQVWRKEPHATNMSQGSRRTAAAVPPFRFLLFSAYLRVLRASALKRCFKQQLATTTPPGTIIRHGPCRPGRSDHDIDQTARARARRGFLQGEGSGGARGLVPRQARLRGRSLVRWRRVPLAAARPRAAGHDAVEPVCGGYAIPGAE